jgi:hypothetical protein
MWSIEWHPTLNGNQSWGRTAIRAGELLHEPSRLFVFVGFSDDRRLGLVVRFGVVVFIIFIIVIVVIVGDTRRHRVCAEETSARSWSAALVDRLNTANAIAGLELPKLRLLSRLLRLTSQRLRRTFPKIRAVRDREPAHVGEPRAHGNLGDIRFRIGLQQGLASLPQAGVP